MALNTNIGTCAPPPQFSSLLFKSIPDKIRIIFHLNLERYAVLTDVCFLTFQLLGEEPYKNISPNVIVAHLGSGCRMSKPAQCSDRV